MHTLRGVDILKPLSSLSQKRFRQTIKLATSVFRRDNDFGNTATSIFRCMDDILADVFEHVVDRSNSAS